MPYDLKTVKQFWENGILKLKNLKRFSLTGYFNRNSWSWDANKVITDHLKNEFSKNFSNIEVYGYLESEQLTPAKEDNSRIFDTNGYYNTFKFTPPKSFTASNEKYGASIHPGSILEIWNLVKKTPHVYYGTFNPSMTFKELKFTEEGLEMIFNLFDLGNDGRPYEMEDMGDYMGYITYAELENLPKYYALPWAGRPTNTKLIKPPPQNQ